MLACVMLVLMGKPAHAALLELGLCEGQLSTTGVSKTGSGTIEVAIVLPASEFAQYEGASLSALRVGLSLVDGISNVKAWVRTSLEGENLCTATFDNPVVGWNEMALDAPCNYTLRADQDLVIGYQFEQSKSTKCISLAGRKSADCYWLARNGEWKNLSADADGAVSVEVVIEGPMVPATNLAVESCSYNPLIAYGEPFTAQIVVRNMAKDDVRGYHCEYQKSMATVMDEIDRSDVVLHYRERDTVTLVMGPELQTPDEVKSLVTVFVVAEGDEIADDNICRLYRSNYTHSYPHLLLMEEFTTEECGNCPRAINTLQQMVNEGYKFAQISHHVGYNTDFLTVPEDKTYLWLYGEDGTFAPAGMFDRTWDPDFHPISLRDYPVFSIGYADDFRPGFEKAIAMPAFVQLAPEVVYDEASRGLSLDVAVEKAPMLDALTDEARLTVILIEDSIPAQHQAGISSTSFRHRHVYRKCLTDAWGDVLTWDEDNHVSVHLEYTLPEEWNADKVEVVAFVNNYNPEDRNDCRVFNTATAELAQNPEQGIAVVREDTGVAQLWYNLMGQPVKGGSPRPAGGVYVRSVRPRVDR